MGKTLALIRADLWRAKRFLQVGRPDKMTVREVIGLYSHHPQIGAITLFRLASGMKRRRIPVIPQLMSFALHVWHGLEIKLDMPVGGGLFIAHCQGSVIFATSIGENVTFIHNVTLGIRNEFEFPTLGNNVFVGAGARILGGVIVGDGAKIGANAVVIGDIPPGATAIGIPAKVRQLEQNGPEFDLEIDTANNSRNGDTQAELL